MSPSNFIAYVLFKMRNLLIHRFQITTNWKLFKKCSKHKSVIDRLRLCNPLQLDIFSLILKKIKIIQQDKKDVLFVL